MLETFSTFCMVAFAPPTLTVIVAEAVAIDLHRVATGIHACVGEKLQNLRTVAEGVRGDSEPAVLKIRGQIDSAVRNAWRRVRLDLRGSGNTDVHGGLSPEVQLRGRSEVLASKDDGSSASEGALRWLKTWCGGDGGSSRRQS